MNHNRLVRYIWSLPVLVGLAFYIPRAISFTFYASSIELCFFALIVAAIIISTRWLSKRILKDNSKAEIFAGFFLFEFLFFEEITQLFQIYLLSSFVLFLLSIGLIVVVLILLIKIKTNFQKFKTYLSFLIIVLTLYQVFNVINLKSKNINPEMLHLDAVSIQSPPDIQYIIVDCYSSNSSLNKFWQFDNRTFRNFLKSRGFIMSDSAKTKFNSTPPCIGSYMNMKWFNLKPDERYDYLSLMRLIRNNQCVELFKNEGYTIYNYSLFDLTDKKKVFNYLRYSDFLGNTLFYRIYTKVRGFIFPYETFPLYNLKLISQNLHSRESKPAFVYTHLMLPHSPLFYGLRIPEKKNHNSEDELLYLEELKLTNALIKPMIDSILKRNPNTVIILQGDHGYRDLTSFSKAEKTKEGFTMLNAIYFPGKKKIDPHILQNPINNFRLVVNTFFNQHLPYEKSLP